MFDSTLGTIISFLITISILVAIHEFGHFWVARRLGVKVLTFSIGFGQRLFKWSDKQGTTYQISVIPLGGFVRMVDEREGDVAPEDLPYAFNRQSVWARFAIVSAGPVINLLFAILLYWAVFIIGTSGLKPIIGEIAPDSLAAQAGLESSDEILLIDGKKIFNWQGVHLQLLQNLGDKKNLTWQVKPVDSNIPINKIVPLPTHEHYEEVNLLELVGIKPFWPKIEAIIGEVSPNMPAARAGLKANDRILQVNNKSITSWSDWVSIIRDNPDKALIIAVERDNKTQLLTIKPEAHTELSGKTYGLIGAKAKPTQLPEHLISIEKYQPLTALYHAIKKTWDVSVLSIKFLYKMIVGEVSSKNLGGPIAIAQGASSSLSSGVIAFISFLALVSISLGLINLFPIPMLDGGHLLFYLIEMIKGKPVSDKVMFSALKVGFVFLIAIMAFALYNDLSRIWG